MNISLAIIGYGNMGKAFLEGMMRKQVISPDDVMVSSPHSTALSQAKERFGVSITTHNRDAVKHADIILLCVKPQKMKEVLSEICPHVLGETLILSLAAGFSLFSIKKAIGKQHQPIVRVMPNIAASVGMSMSGWYANTHVTKEQKIWVRNLLLSVGREKEVVSEDMLDVVTAVSGSGPAYYFYFTEALIVAANKLGMSREDSLEYVTQTFLGASELLKTSKKTPEELRNDVTSKGGTTEAAVNFFSQNKLMKTVEDAVESAFSRVKDLSSQVT